VDFFDHQDRARSASRLLVVVYALLVLGVVLLLDVLMHLILVRYLDPADLWRLHLAVSLGLGGAILAGSWWRWRELAKGGAVVALELGGREVVHGQATAAQRQLLNVTEEMALASGLPVPAVYVLDEPAINAFTAGLTARDAVVVVTRGALERLSRDELQGVIGHELSHILHGDMRLNLRLMALAHGLLVVSMSGRIVMERGMDGDDLRASFAAVSLGAILFVVGGLGWMAGCLLTASVSRRRELLADAAAVQFTRNPAGLAGALKKLGLRGHASILRSARAAAVSHLCIATPVPRPFLGWLDNHPPLTERIRILDPGWDGTWTEIAPIVPLNPKYLQPATTGPATGRKALAVADPGQTVMAATLVATLPDELRAATSDPQEACGAVLACLLSADTTLRLAQVDALVAAEPALAVRVQHHGRTLDVLGPGARLPVLELSAPALARLAAGQRRTLVELVTAMRAAARSDLTVQVAGGLVALSLAPPVLPRGDVHALKPLLPALRPVLAALAASAGPTGMNQAWAAGLTRLGLTVEPQPTVDAAELDGHLAALNRASGGLKRRILSACATTVAADGHIAVREAELLRLVAASLGCPLPPALPGTEATSPSTPAP